MHKLLCTLALFLGWSVAGHAQEPKEKGPERWEATIQKFEAEDRAKAPAKNGVLFTGSSTIVFWNLEKDFPEYAPLNRGFGGSTVSEVLHFFDRVITPYAPRTLVFYSGDNDIARGATPEAVIADYQELIRRVEEALPATTLILLGIKPSIARLALWPKMQEVNEALRKLAGDKERVEFIDTAPTLLDADGMPKRELLKEDGLHLNEAGYALWTPLVRAALEKAHDLP